MFQCTSCSALFKSRQILNRFSIIIVIIEYITLGFESFVMQSNQIKSQGMWQEFHVGDHLSALTAPRASSPKNCWKFTTVRSHLLVMFARRPSKAQNGWRNTKCLTAKKGISSATSVRRVSKDLQSSKCTCGLTPVKSHSAAVSVRTSLQPQVN